MQTQVTESVEAAARRIRGGEVVAFPTETVYGLGADAFQPDAVQRIFAAKGRPADNPLIVHLAQADQIDRVTASVSEAAEALLDAFAPGPLTVILPKADAVPDVVTAGLDTVGVRIPSHPVATAFLSACKTPVAAPSANRSGRPSPTTWEAVADDLSGRIPCILRGDRTDAGVESTVVDCTSAVPVILRPGAVTAEAIREVCPDVQVEAPRDDGAARSPGTKHRHYAPSARVQVVTGPEEAAPGASHAYVGLDAPDDPDGFGRVFVAADVAEYAHEVFHFFRTCDRDELDVIFAQAVDASGLGRALNDRLRRAALR